MNEYEQLKKRKAEIIERQRRAAIKNNPLVKYCLERGLISTRKIATILDCSVQDVDPNMQGRSRTKNKWQPMETTPTTRKISLRIKVNPDEYRTVAGRWINGYQWVFEGMLTFTPSAWKEQDE